MIYRVAQKNFMMWSRGKVFENLWCDVEEKCLKNSKIFFDGVFLSIYSHLVKKLELSKLHRKKSYGALKILKKVVQKGSLSKKRHIFLFYMKTN